MIAGTPTMPGQVSQSQIMQYLQALQGNPMQGQASNDLTGLYNGYQQAFQAIAPEEQAALGNYDTQSGLAASSAIGGLNSRGLTESLLGSKMQAGGPLQGGYGSGALQQLATQRLLGRNQMQQGFAGQANSLNNSLLSEAGQDVQGWGGLGINQQMLQAQIQSQQPNIFGLLGLGVSAAGAFA